MPTIPGSASQCETGNGTRLSSPAVTERVRFPWIAPLKNLDALPTVQKYLIVVSRSRHFWQSRCCSRGNSRRNAEFQCVQNHPPTLATLHNNFGGGPTRNMFHSG